jgi:hypothetical protein
VREEVTCLLVAGCRRASTILSQRTPRQFAHETLRSGSAVRAYEK